MPGTNKKHKDRLFKFIFGNPEHKEWTLSLYNALNGSRHTNPDDITFNTIEDAVYLGMQNDTSFILLPVMSFWEHQSSFNPNLPVRFLIYAGRAYDSYLTDNDIYRYGTVLHKLPTPKCVCFYNGLQEQPDERILKLSEAFAHSGMESDIELKIRMLNINYGRNKALMEQCIFLNEYAWFIDAIRRHQKVMHNLDAAVDAALEEMPDDFVLKRFLRTNKAEVKGMYLTEYDEEKERRLACEEAAMLGHEKGLEEGHAAGFEEGKALGLEEGKALGLEEGKALGLEEGKALGMKEGRAAGRVAGHLEGCSFERDRVARDMLKENMPLNLIEKISGLPEYSIYNIAQSLGIAVVV